MKTEECKVRGRRRTRQGADRNKSVHVRLCYLGRDRHNTCPHGPPGLEQGSAGFFCKGSKYFQICVSYISDAITELCCCLMKAIMDNTYTNGQDLC